MDDLRIAGKVALVTAASDGLGFACARRLAESGCRLIICARGEERLKKAQSRISAETGAEVHFLCCDLSSAGDISRLIREAEERFSGIDILVANTGHIAYGGIMDLADVDWEAAFNLLIMGAVRIARGCIPLMLARGGGDIVFLSSSVAREPLPHLLLSNVFRVGVVALAKSLSASLAGQNIRVNSVTPGYFDTGRVRNHLDELVANDPAISRSESVQWLADPIPLGRIGTARELAELVAFLASRRAEFLTGACVQIDGGSARGLF